MSVSLFLVLEEAEPDHYAELNSPSENVYSEAICGGTTVKTATGTTLQ